MIRNLNAEARDIPNRAYAYNVDYTIRGYMLRKFSTHFTGGHALELGCYKGEISKKLWPHFRSLTVVEGASELIPEAQKTCAGGNVKFIHGMFETVELVGKFDAVFLIHTLEHLEDPLLVLNRIREWLTPTGKLYLAVPNAYAASRQIAVNMGVVPACEAVTDGEYKHGHRRTYSLESLTVDVLAAGLKPIASGGILFKALSNQQFDAAMKANIIGEAYLDGCFALGEKLPDLCASVFLVCER